MANSHLLPPEKTPLNQHSLAALELWLHEIGAKRNFKDKSLWELDMPSWSASIRMERNDLKIVWKKGEKQSQCIFSYGLPRKDVHDAMMEGPD
tara:strand:+ start:518 stop:796 length:279 start_codon:yes stop_codon:yes gene_type:complete